ncbi:hypothetical protein B0H14DRAFT_2614571 [Mycena olivaceomarginata]|nr:hypothetical protein B0H14DRAFT_2614571 [Mycena olivaceomarginata]
MSSGLFPSGTCKELLRVFWTLILRMPPPLYSVIGWILILIFNLLAVSTSGMNKMGRLQFKLRSFCDKCNKVDYRAVLIRLHKRARYICDWRWTACAAWALPHIIEIIGIVRIAQGTNFGRNVRIWSERGEIVAAGVRFANNLGIECQNGDIIALACGLSRDDWFVQTLSPENTEKTALPPMRRGKMGSR